MPASCSALGCKNRLSKGSPIKYFCFPLKNEPLCKAWVEASGRVDFKPSKSSKMCSQHFLETDFLDKPCSLKTKLKPEAVPSVFAEGPVLRAKRLKNRKRSNNDTIVETIYIPEGIPDPPPEIQKKDKASQTKEIVDSKRTRIADGVEVREYGTQTKALATPDSTETRKKVKIYQQKIRRKDRLIKRLENTIKSLLTKELIEMLEAKQKNEECGKSRGDPENGEVQDEEMSEDAKVELEEEEGEI